MNKQQDFTPWRKKQVVLKHLELNPRGLKANIRAICDF